VNNKPTRRLLPCHGRTCTDERYCTYFHTIAYTIHGHLAFLCKQALRMLGAGCWLMSSLVSPLPPFPTGIFSIPSTTRFGAKTFPEGNLRDLCQHFLSCSLCSVLLCSAPLHLLFPSSHHHHHRRARNYFASRIQLLLLTAPKSPLSLSLSFPLPLRSWSSVVDDLTFPAPTAS